MYDTILRAKERQNERYKSSMKYNSSLSSSEIQKQITLGPKEKALLDAAATKLKLSARSYFKVIKVARTIADLADDQDISTTHLAEALQYR